MALLETPAGDLGWAAAPFSLANPAGAIYGLDDLKGPRGLVLAFICNHCPYVKAMIGRFVADAGVLQGMGVGVAAIMPNDWSTHPADAPDRMEDFARDHGFTFPYLVDADQAVAKAYGAVCTPDLFGFDGGLILRYRGRLDAGRVEAPPADAPRDLLEAMRAIAEGRPAPDEQPASMGCSIKWRAA